MRGQALVEHLVCLAVAASLAALMAGGLAAASAASGHMLHVEAGAVAAASREVNQSVLRASVSSAGGG